MSKIEITGIKIDSERDIESINIQVNYKSMDLVTEELEDRPKEGSKESTQSSESSSSQPFRNIY